VQFAEMTRQRSGRQLQAAIPFMIDVRACRERRPENFRQIVNDNFGGVWKSRLHQPDRLPPDVKKRIR